ncbi:hypothetical protein FNW25_15830 [Flavobacterium franklandianum]|uniref:hypothetical protein n=1 Tax=Flavobacterium franklandianum TaxID=2594430 RepID=UPI00117A566E|nr:hypothetical protein [Flavobacterium franklandianum]TRX21470.1 hypothetical protein FNW25_15830 [Flavobacterium franklandianum]
METNVKLSENLTLTGISENNEENGKLITVECFFEFFGKDGNAFVVIERLDEEYPRYAMTEICNELSNSFNELLDDEENWKKIGVEIKKYIQYWNKLNSDEDFE